MSVIIKSGADTNTASVDANKRLFVNLATAVSLQPGFADVSTEVTDGTAPLSGMTPVTRTNRRVISTLAGRQSVSMPTIVFHDNFNHATFNASVYQGVDTTMTRAVSGGFLNFNSGNSTTAGQGTQAKTYRTFSIYGDTTTHIEHWFQLQVVPQTNNVCEWGAFYCTGVATPTDGVYFRITNTATLECVINRNGVETTTAVTGATIDAATTYHTAISVSNDVIEFYFNEKLVVSQIPRGTAASGISLSGNLPLMTRIYNTGAVGSAQQFKLAEHMVTLSGIANNKPWNEAASGMGLHSITTPPGVATASQTANYVLSSGPVATTLASNGGYLTLGGQWSAAMVAGSESDYCIFNYLNPVGTATIPGRNLYINYVRIGETFNTVAANAATAINLQWGFGVGSAATAISTADSLTAGTRSPRRLVFGGQQFPTSAAIGAMSPGISYQFIPPVLVEPGTYAQTYLRVVTGTATGNTIRGTVGISGNWE